MKTTISNYVSMERAEIKKANPLDRVREKYSKLYDQQEKVVPGIESRRALVEEVSQYSKLRSQTNDIWE